MFDIKVTISGVHGFSEERGQATLLLNHFIGDQLYNTSFVVPASCLLPEAGVSRLKVGDVLVLLKSEEDV